MIGGIETAFQGRVGKPPTMRTSAAGKCWCKFSVAVGSDDAITWVNVSAFGPIAEAIGSLQKGSQIYVEGRLKLALWKDANGQDRSGLQVAATLVQPLWLIGQRRPQKQREGSKFVQGAPNSSAARDWQRPPQTPASDERRAFDHEIRF